MANLILPPVWQGRDRDITDRETYRNRRSFLREVGVGTIGLMATAAMPSCVDSAAMNTGAPAGPLDTIPKNAPRHGLPAVRNAAFTVPEREVTDRISASSYNNFYEFDGSSKRVWHLTSEYEPFPWQIEVDGLVEQKMRLDVDALIREFGVEERLYRFRCVEAWSMTIPWTGFPLARLIEKCAPKPQATHVRFVSEARKKQMPGVRNQPWYKWPYYEGLRMDEAMNEIAFVATGMYGEPLPKQNGSPLRLVLPWKYGYKGAKAILKLEFLDRQPPTFWNDLAPDEYDFSSNVNPNVPHPRWTQANERFIQTVDDIRRVDTKLFNGYADWVGDLYPSEPRG